MLDRGILREHSEMCDDEIAKHRLIHSKTRRPRFIQKSCTNIVRIFPTVSRAPKKIEYVCRAIIRKTPIIACDRASAASEHLQPPSSSSPARAPSFSRLPQPKRHLRPIKQRVKTPADGVYLQFPFSYSRIRFFSATNPAQISSISRFVSLLSINSGSSSNNNGVPASLAVAATAVLIVAGNDCACSSSSSIRHNWHLMSRAAAFIRRRHLAAGENNLLALSQRPLVFASNCNRPLLCWPIARVSHVIGQLKGDCV